MLYSTLQGSKSFLEVFFLQCIWVSLCLTVSSLSCRRLNEHCKSSVNEKCFVHFKKFHPDYPYLKKKWWAIMKLKRQENIFHQEPWVCIKSEFFFNLLFKAITFALIIYNGTTISWHSENSICSMKMSWKVLLIFSI